MGGWCVVERSQIVVKIKMMRGVEDGRGEGARGGKFVRGASGGCGVSSFGTYLTRTNRRN